MQIEHGLLLVEGKSAARYRLLVSLWNLAAGAKSEAARLKRWSEVSGLPLSEVRRLARPLVEAEICLPDGSVAPEALAIVRAVIAEALEQKKGKAK